MNAQMFAESRDLSSNTVVVRKDFTPKIVSRDHMNTVARRGFVGSEIFKEERKAGWGVGKIGESALPIIYADALLTGVLLLIVIK
jgi:hypothetical protein